MSLISVHIAIVILLSILQGNIYTAKDDCGWCSSIISSERRESPELR